MYHLYVSLLVTTEEKQSLITVVSLVCPLCLYSMKHMGKNRPDSLMLGTDHKALPTLNCFVLPDRTDFCILGSCLFNEHIISVNFTELKLGLKS